jgi:hypothetical protein
MSRMTRRKLGVPSRSTPRKKFDLNGVLAGRETLRKNLENDRKRETLVPFDVLGRDW